VNKQPWTKAEINFVLREYKKGFGRKVLTKLFNSKFPDSKRTVDSIKHCLETHGADVNRDLPKVLILDIETAPMLSYVWGLFDQNIPLNMIKRDWFILSFTAKWLHDDKIIYKDQRGKKGRSLENDKPLLVCLQKLMDEADIIIGQNSNAFDIKKINSKFLEHSLEVPSPYKKIDTYVLAKRHFSLTSNKLEYMSKKFNKKYKKQDHEEFSGFKLWDECLKGNLKAWKCMEKYNNFDVLATEELFLRLAEFDKTEVVASALRAFHNRNKKV
jgi:hypothetical protein